VDVEQQRILQWTIGVTYDNGSYTQAPFTDCTKEEFEKMFEKLHSIDLKNVVEVSDETDLSGELACSGGACEVK
jgi:hypothetical protein